MQIAWQFMRYVVVGLSVNLAAFLAYLLLTGVGLGPKTAMSCLFLAGVLASFRFNRDWTFDDRGALSSSFVRYIIIYVFAYILNWVALYFLVEIRGWPHQWVQGIMILALAAMLFGLQKFWVFRDGEVP